MALHVIVGSGAVGSGTATVLADAGHHVRIVTRSGTGPDHPNVELVAADATDRGRLGELTAEAHSLYNAASPRYHQWKTAWPPLAASFLATAEATGARLITMSNLYGFAQGASPMRASDPLEPPSRKGAIRAGMWGDALAAHDQGRILATEARASDYVGPGLGETSHLGDRVMPRALAGKNVSFIGDPAMAHSWTYIADVCAALATIGTDDRSLGRAWHVPTAPPRSMQFMVDRTCELAGVEPVRVRSIPKLALRLGGVFVPEIRELVEMRYQFTEPFEIDARDTTDTFGLEPTPLDQQLRATADAYRVSATAS